MVTYKKGVCIKKFPSSLALQKITVALSQALHRLENGTTGDFVAMDIREAMLQLGNITGQIDIDTDILGAIFFEVLYPKVGSYYIYLVLYRN